MLAPFKESQSPGVRRIYCHVLPENGKVACERNWTPKLDHCQALATFGVGNRFCLGGTGALMAIGTFARGLLMNYSFSELISGHAVNSAYLASTLNVQGPQIFLIKKLGVQIFIKFTGIKSEEISKK